MDNAIDRISHYTAASVVCFVNSYALESDLSGGYRYPPFEQQGPGHQPGGGGGTPLYEIKVCAAPKGRVFQPFSS